MYTQLLRFFGHRAAHKKLGKVLDFRFGFNLFRDGRVPPGTKLVALSFGVIATAALIVLEVPLEGLLGVIVPFVGEVFDVAFDGLEAVVLPFLLAALFLPRLAPATLVQQLRLK